MQIVPVESTALAAIGYDQTRELLRVEFCRRAIYHYFGVPASLHQGLLAASSKGSYFNQVIRGRFPFCLISELRADGPDSQCPSGAGGGGR
jgi:hypothetical protein